MTNIIQAMEDDEAFARGTHFNCPMISGADVTPIAYRLLRRSPSAS